MPTPISPWEQLNEILHGEDGSNIRLYDQEMASEPLVNFSLILTSRSSRMTDIGSLITRTDREIRRAVTIFASEPYYLGERYNRPRPISPNYGGLEVADATPGSFHMLLEAYGEVVSLLTSQPLQALIAALTLGQSAGSIRLWRRRKKDPLAGMSARQLLEVLNEFNGNTTRIMRGQDPDLEIDTQETEDEAQLSFPVTTQGVPLPPPFPDMPHGVAVPPAPSGPANQSGAFIVKGRRITYIRNHPDGSQDIIYVDG
jgi:hypothetical protein